MVLEGDPDYVNENIFDPCELWSKVYKNGEAVLRGSVVFELHYWGLGVELWGGQRNGVRTISFDIHIGPINGWLSYERYFYPVPRG